MDLDDITHGYVGASGDVHMEKMLVWAMERTA